MRLRRIYFLILILLNFSLIFTVNSVSGLGFLHETREIYFNHRKEALNSTALSFTEGNWSFTEPENYSFNTTEIEVSSGSAKLRAFDVENGGGSSIKYKTLSNGLIELMEKRSPIARHFYNSTSNSYKYMSDELVYKENVVSGSNWITLEEYPIRYIIRLRNGSLEAFNSGIQLSNYIDQIDNSSMWFIGIETFGGVLGYYLNSQDSINGHAQALYYPRLKSGKISAYNQPLYAVFGNIYAKVGATWYNTTFNNRSLFNPSNNPQNHLSFFQNSSIYEMKFYASDLALLGYNFDIICGIKYNLTDNLFHFITEFRCTDRDFDDLGLGYNILSTPQAEGTPYEVSKFRLYNSTYSKVVGKQTLWKHDELIDNSLSKVDIISENGNSFTFTYEDMSNVFSTDYLELINYDLPSGDERKALLTGMFGYGSYSQGNWIKIDPTFSERLVNTIDDFDIDEDYAYDGATLWVGYTADPYSANSMIAYNSTINVEIYSIFNIEMSLYVETEDIEADEYTAIGIYDSGDSDHIWDYDEAILDVSGAHGQTTYWNDTTWFNGNGLTGNQTFGDSELSTLFSNWINWHNSDPTDRMYIPLKLFAGDGMDSGTDDIETFSASDNPINSWRPTLAFEYLLTPDIKPPEIDSPSDKELTLGFQGENITWIPTERDNGSDSFVVWKNGSLFDSGSWSNQTPIVVSLDPLNSTTGYFNLTIFINNTIGNNASDTVFINITTYIYPIGVIEALEAITIKTPIDEFNETAIKPTNTEIKYQAIINNKIKYFNGSDWIDISIGENDSFYYDNEANNESVMNNNLLTLGELGNFRFKAFLRNLNNDTPLLDNIYINTSIQVSAFELRLMANNTVENLGFNYDYMKIEFTSTFITQNMSIGDTINFSIGLVNRYETYEFEALILYDLEILENNVFEFAFVVNTNEIDLEETESRNFSVVNNYQKNDLVFVVLRDSNVFQTGFTRLKIEYYKTDFEVRQDWIEEIWDFDSLFDIPLAFISLPLVLLSSEFWYIQFLGVVIGVVFLATFILFAKMLWNEIGDVIG